MTLNQASKTGQRTGSDEDDWFYPVSSGGFDQYRARRVQNRESDSKLGTNTDCGAILRSLPSVHRGWSGYSDGARKRGAFAAPPYFQVGDQVPSQ